MNIPESDLQKYRSERRKMSDKQKEALRRGRESKKNNISMSIKNIPVIKHKKGVVNKPGSMVELSNRAVAKVQKDGRFKIMYINKKKNVKYIGTYNTQNEADKNFNNALKLDKNVKMYIIEFLPNGKKEIVKSYKNPKINMKSKKRFKKHMMYKGNKKEMADTYKEHLELKNKGFGHSSTGY